MTVSPTEKVILFGLVCYRDTVNVEAFLEHIRGIKVPEGWRVEIAIADNSGSFGASSGIFRDICLCEPGENLGYLGGSAYAIRNWMSMHNMIPEWTGIANTDIAFDRDFFTRLIRLQCPENVAVLAPDITLKNGRRQNPYRKKRPSSLEMYLYTLIYRSSILTRSLDRLKYFLCYMRDKVPNGLAPKGSLPMDKNLDYRIIYAPHGSLMFLHKTFFEQGGSLNFDGFMYGEEIYIAEEARALNLRIAWIPDLRVVHFDKAATGKVSHAQKRLWRLDSANILWRRYFSGQ